MTRSQGTTGLIRSGSPCIRAIASRIAARSTTHGTPVKSCSTTRAGMKGISERGRAVPVPAAELADVLLGDHAAAGMAERVLQQHADGEGQSVELGDALPRELGRR